MPSLLGKEQEGYRPTGCTSGSLREVVQLKRSPSTPRERVWGSPVEFAAAEFNKSGVEGQKILHRVHIMNEGRSL